MLSQRPDPASYEAAARLGRAALAWEVLRRDPAYRAAFRTSQISGAMTPADPAFTAQWGLHFP